MRNNDVTRDLILYAVLLTFLIYYFLIASLILYSFTEVNIVYNIVNGTELQVK